MKKEYERTPGLLYDSQLLSQNGMGLLRRDRRTTSFPVSLHPRLHRKAVSIALELSKEHDSLVDLHDVINMGLLILSNLRDFQGQNGDAEWTPWLDSL